MKRRKVSTTIQQCLKHVDWSTEITEPSTHIDNEYSRAGVNDPKIMITTSRDPSSKLLQFAKVPASLTPRTNRTMIIA